MHAYGNGGGGIDGIQHRERTIEKRETFTQFICFKKHQYKNNIDFRILPTQLRFVHFGGRAECAKLRRCMPFIASGICCPYTRACVWVCGGGDGERARRLQQHAQCPFDCALIWNIFIAAN